MPFLFAGIAQSGMAYFRHIRFPHPFVAKLPGIHLETRQKTVLQLGEARCECDISGIDNEAFGRFLIILPFSAPCRHSRRVFISSQSLASMPMSHSGKPDDAFPRDKCDICGAWDLR
jgi:hypothetical protein